MEEVWRVYQGRRIRREGNLRMKEMERPFSVKFILGRVKASLELLLFLAFSRCLVMNLFGDENPRLNFDNYRDPPFFYCLNLGSLPSPDSDYAFPSALEISLLIWSYDIGIDEEYSYWKGYVRKKEKKKHKIK